MKVLTLIFTICAMSLAQAEEKIKMSFNNEDLLKVIEVYSKASKQKFVVDPSVRGKISILLPEPVAMQEAFNQLSSALAVNGFAISTQGDTMVIKSARNIQRDLIEVSTERPSLKPERMYTWIYNVQHLSASMLFRDFRILSSKDGEITFVTDTNQLVMTDWVSNLNRIGNLLKEIDKPLNPITAKLVEAAKKQTDSRRKELVIRKDVQSEKAEKVEKVEKTEN